MTDKFFRALADEENKHLKNMNREYIIESLSRNLPLGLKGAVESFQMWDHVGNCCAAAMFKTGADTFELYLHEFNSSIPKRYVGNLALMKNRMMHFFNQKATQGFQETLADTAGNPIN